MEGPRSATDSMEAARGRVAQILGALLLAGCGASQAAQGPTAPSDAGLTSAYCLSIMTLNKASLEVLEFDDPVLEQQRGGAIRIAEATIGRLERHLALRPKGVDQAALNSAAERGVADYRRMTAAAEACSAPCARSAHRNDLEAARCSAA